MIDQIARLHRFRISKYLFIILEIVYRSFLKIAAINGNEMSLKTTVDLLKISVFEFLELGNSATLTI